MLEGKYTVLPWDDLKRELGKVEKPARYSGGEINAFRKKAPPADVHFALAFPDVYEVGMSHLGSHILYSVLNSREDVLCERTYAPWPDMEDLLRVKGWPLFTLESRLPLKAFDIVGFSLQYELTYTNVLAMLDLGQVPLRSCDREENHPLVIAGGPCALSGEPLAEFIDAFVLGDGEEVVLEVVDAYKSWRRSGAVRDRLLLSLSSVAGVYVPSLYQPKYRDGGMGPLEETVPVMGRGQAFAPVIKRRVLKDLDRAPYVEKPLIPLIPPIHDRAVVEVFRGCTQGCRFCQAGMIYRPVRERRPEEVCSMARDLLGHSGYDEVSLVSLSSADYSHIGELLTSLLSDNPCGARVSLPSLRVDSFSVGLAQMLGSSTKSGLTLAPEAGSQRLRDVINKKVTQEDLLDAASAAFKAGYSHIKLYFMIGLPGETDEDVKAIGHLASLVRETGRDLGKKPTVVVSVSGFVPKAHTPFQWEACLSQEELERRQRLLKRTLRGPGLVFRYHDAGLTWLEAVFARGDRRLGQALEIAFRSGRRFDAWPERFDRAVWEGIFRQAGIDPDSYASRERARDELFPWDHLQSGVDKAFLWKERQKARRGERTEDCRWHPCEGCGVCSGLKVQTSIAPKAIAEPISPEAGGHMPAPTPSTHLRRSSLEQGLPEAGAVKIRVVYEKGDPVRFLSHLDVARVIHMSLKRALWPVQMSRGFSPKPRVSFYSPLPVGTAGKEEYFDVLLSECPPLSDLVRSLSRAVPEGFSVSGAFEVPVRTPSLDQRIRGSVYSIELRDVDKRQVAAALHAFTEDDTVSFDVDRRSGTRTLDLRKFVRDIGEPQSASGKPGFVTMDMIIQHYDGRTVRPEWVLAALTRYGLSMDPKEAIIDRRKILFD